MIAEERSAIVQAADVIVVGRLKNPKIDAGGQELRIQGVIAADEVIVGDYSPGDSFHYSFYCDACPHPLPGAIRELSQKSLWFLVGPQRGIWGSAGPSDGDAGIRRLSEIEAVRGYLASPPARPRRSR